MTESAFLVLITVSGAAACMRFSRKLSPVIAGIVGPIVGTAVYVLVSVVLVSIGRFSATTATLGVVAVGLIIGGWSLVRRESGREAAIDLTVIVTAGVAVALLTWLAGRVSVTRVSFDSFFYLMAGESIEASGSMNALPFSFGEALKRQLLVPAVQAIGSTTGLGYVRAWAPVVAISAVSATGWLGWMGMARFGVSIRVRVATIVASLAFVVSVNQVLLHALYINSHMAIAALLVVAVGFCWFAAVDADWLLAVPAGILFAAVVPSRAEAVIVVGMFLVPVIVARAVPNPIRWILAAPTAAVTIVWYSWGISSGLPNLTGADGVAVLANLFLACGLIGLVVLASSERFHRLVQLLPWLVVSAPVLLLLAQVFRDFDQVWSTLSAMAVNAATEGLWATFWWAIPPLVLISAVAVRFAYQSFFLFPMAAFVLWVPVFAFVRGKAYRIGWGDSGNRVLMHIALVSILYLILAVGAVRQGDAFDQTPGSDGTGDAIPA